MRRPFGRRFTSRVAMLTALILLLAACSGDGALVETAPDRPSDTQQVTAASTTTTTTTTTTSSSTSSGLICEDPPPTEIGLGASSDAGVTDAAPTACFWVEVPAGLTTIAFEITGLTGDLNLAVGYGFVDTLQYNTGEFWPSRQAGTADELVAIDNPTPGPYFIKVGPAGQMVASSFVVSTRATPETNSEPTGDLPSTTECARPATELRLDEAATGEVVARDTSPQPRSYFCVQVPGGSGSLTIEVSDLDGDLDLFVRRAGAQDLWTDRNRGGTGRTVTIDGPGAGAYFIDLAGAYPGAGSTFTVVATTG